MKNAWNDRMLAVRGIPATARLTALIALLTLLANVAVPAAHARFILLDASFDGLAVGSSLGRGGARLEEPIATADDSHSEVVVEDATGDHSVRILDTTAADPDVLTFAFFDGREIEAGKLNISLTIQPESLDYYEVVIKAPLGAGPIFFRLQFTAAGHAYASDGNGTTPVQVASYSANDEIRVELRFNQNNNRYDFLLDGTPIVENKLHGVTTRGIGSLVVGNRLDSDTTGSIRIDDLSVDLVPGADQGHVQLVADFDDEPIGEVIGTGGAELGQPVRLGSCSPTVETGGFPTPSLRMLDESTTAATVADFAFLEEAELTGEDVSFSWLLAFQNYQNFLVNIHEPEVITQIFFRIRFTVDGGYSLYDLAGGAAPYYSGNYSTQQPIRIEVAFLGATGEYSVWLNNERIAHRRQHGVTGYGIAGVGFGHEFDLDLDGQARVDNIQVHTLAEQATPVEDMDLPAAAAINLVAAPNPFNPATEIRFSLPRPGNVRLDIFDLRGARVRRVFDETAAAGDHRLRWNGTDAAGRRVASGVYRAALIVDGVMVRHLTMTLVK